MNRAQSRVARHLTEAPRVPSSSEFAAIKDGLTKAEQELSAIRHHFANAKMLTAANYNAVKLRSQYERAVAAVAELRNAIS